MFLDLAFLSELAESLSDLMEPVGLLVYCSFSGELSERSAVPTIWQISGELGVREVPMPCRMVEVEKAGGLLCRSGCGLGLLLSAEPFKWPVLMASSDPSFALLSARGCGVHYIIH